MIRPSCCVWSRGPWCWAGARGSGGGDLWPHARPPARHGRRAPHGGSRVTGGGVALGPAVASPLCVAGDVAPPALAPSTLPRCRATGGGGSDGVRKGLCSPTWKAPLSCGTCLFLSGDHTLGQQGWGRPCAGPTSLCPQPHGRSWDAERTHGAGLSDRREEPVGRRGRKCQSERAVLTAPGALGVPSQSCLCSPLPVLHAVAVSDGWTVSPP